MSHHEALIARVAVEHVDRAPVGEARDGQLGDATEGGGRIGGPRHGVSGVGQQPGPFAIIENRLTAHTSDPPWGEGRKRCARQEPG